MNTRSSLNNAILNFAFTGVMQPHRPEEVGALARLAELVSVVRGRERRESLQVIPRP